MKVTLPTFAEFIVSTGPTRIVKVRAAKKLLDSAEEYRRIDYWLSMRQAAHEAFGAGGDKSILTRCVDHLDDAKKVDNYREVAAGLSKFIGRRRVVTRPAGSRPWTSGTLTVTVRPDFVIDVDGTEHVALIYWKADGLTQHKVNPVLQILRDTHGHIAEPMIIEARTGKAFAITRPVRGLSSLLASEALAFVSLWESDLEAA